MSLNPSLYAELLDLLEAVCRAEASRTELARLESLVHNNPAALAFYVDYLDIHVQLRWSIAERESADEPQRPGSRPAVPPQSPSRSPVLGFLSGLWSGGWESPGVTAFTWLALACVCTGLVLTIVFSIVLVFRGTGVNPHGDAPQVAEQKGEGGRAGHPRSGSGETAKAEPLTAPPSSLLLPPSSASVARLIHAADCHWVIGSHSPHVGDDLEPSRKLALMSGLAEIMFTSGVRALLEGPATLEIGSKTSTFLHQGKVTVTVLDPDARGFEVRTPGMKFTDLGTEFGVIVAKDGTQEMHVFRGTVRAETDGEEIGGRGDTETSGRGDSSAPASSRPRVPMSSLILAAHQAVRIAAPGKPIEPIKADEKQFVRAAQMAEILADKSPEYARWKKSSEDLRKRADMIAYYDFRRDDGDHMVLHNRAATGMQFDGRLVGGTRWCEGRVAGKQALEFVESGSGVRVTIPVPFRQLTLIAWMKKHSVADPPFAAILNSNDFRSRAGAVHWQFGAGPTGLYLDVSKGTKNANMTRHAVFSSHDTALNQWCMYAATFDAATLTGSVYCNGILIARETFGKVASAEIGAATIGGYMPQGQVEDPNRTLGGNIDELMVFKSIVPKEEIERIYHAESQN